MNAFLALTPVVLALVVWRYRRLLPTGSVWLALGLAISTVGDVWLWAIGGAWYPSYVWLPVQLACVIRAVSPGREWVGLWTWLAMLGLYDIAFVSGPEVLVTGVGSTAALAIAVRSGHRLTVPVALYFGAGTVAYLGMVSALGSGWFMAWWWAYQAARVLGWCALAEIVRHRWWRDRKARRRTPDVLMYGPRLVPHALMDWRH